MGETYKSFYDKMAFEVKDKVEAYDEGESDNSKFFPFEDGMWLTSEAINTLLLESETKRTRVRTYTFDQDTKIWTLPHWVGRLYAIRPSCTSVWQNIGDVSVSGEDYTMISEDQIRNNTSAGWSKGDEIEINGIIFPDEITDANDSIEFPREHMELLRLSLLIKVFGRKGKDVPQSVMAMYQRLHRVWRTSPPKVVAKRQLPFRGFGLGS